MKVTILGNAAGGSFQGRYYSAQFLEHGKSRFLIDCGEGTQMRLFDFKVSHFTTQAVFISHLHGDHVFGLIGLLNSWSMMGRTKALKIFAPEGLAELIEVHLRICTAYLTYPVDVQVVDTLKHLKIYENKTLEVWSIPLLHRVPSTGYLFREKEKARNIIAEKIQQYKLDYAQIRVVKAGKDIVLADGRSIANAELTTTPKPLLSYAYCSDTMPSPQVAELVRGVSCLYHEATLTQEHERAAAGGMHSTAAQAAEIARQAEVGRLLIGHISVRYDTFEQLLEEAQAIFPKTSIAEEGLVLEVQ